MITDHTPHRIGRYRVVREVGRGGQGVVFLAEDPDGTRVAIKLLRDHGDDRARARFHKEVATARRVAPFCTARILEVGEERGAPYVVTEYIDGPSLRELVRRDGPRSGPELYRLAVGTATALAAIHEAGVVHRDFKPGNVLVGPDGPRVIDFGIARALDVTATATDSIIGTPAFMAPEQFAGREIGPAADVFAWGATIAYAANGRPPHGQDSVPAIMGRLGKGESDLGRLDGPLYRLVLDCLQHDPRRRPAARHLLTRLLERDSTRDALETVLEHGRDLAATADATLVDGRTMRWTSLRSTDRPVRRTDRRKGGAMAAAGTAAAVAAAVTATIILVNGGDGERPRARASASATANRPATPAQISAAIQKATGERRTYALTVEGYNGQGIEGLDAEGRCQIASGSRTDCNLSVRDDPGGISPTSVVLVEDSAYLDGVTNPKAYPVDRGSEPEEPSIRYARDARWAGSSQHILELVRKAREPQAMNDSSSITYRGKVPIETMIEADWAGGWYEQFRALSGDVNFTVVTSPDHLPQSLELNIYGTAQNSDVDMRATYKVSYQKWGTAGNVTAPF